MNIDKNNPASSCDIAKLQEYVGDHFNGSMPIDYLDFLKQSDGAQIENAYLFSALDVTSLNDEFSYNNQVRIGDIGKSDDLVFSFHNSQFEVVTMGHADEVIATFNDFHGLIEYLMAE